MTQNELLINYILEYGSATPAKLTGTPYKDGFFGSEISRRARDLRKAGRLVSVKEGKFEKYFLVDQDVKEDLGELAMAEISQETYEKIFGQDFEEQTEKLNL